MTKRIFRSIVCVAGSVLLLSLIFIMGVLYEHFTTVQKLQLEAQTTLAVHGVENEGSEYLQDLNLSGEYRLTWLDTAGNVLYDSAVEASDLENHAEREEIKEAYETGVGESNRYSATLTERTIYRAERLSDGTVLRMSVTVNSVFSLVLGMLQPVCIVLVAAVILSAILANRLSKKIVEPLNALDLDDPLENEAYEELSPLLRRIDRQHREIRKQLAILHEKQEEFDTVTEGMKEGIVLINEKDRIVSMNRSARELLQAESGEVGKEFLQVNRNVVLQNLIERAKQGEHAEAMVEFDGAEYSATVSPIYSEEELRGVAMLLFDITDKERAEQIRREFTANVSHELKTPLHSILGAAELLKSGIAEPEDSPRFLNQIYNESKRMVTLVDDIIRLSKLDEGVEDSPREEIKLLSCALDTVNQLSQAATEQGVTLKCTGEDVVIRGIYPQIRELLFNLCDNAIKYNRPGGTVNIFVSEQAGKALLSVQDSGIGIPREHLGRIFERFYRVDKSHSKEIGGTGLGLSIVKHIAKVHNAEVEVKSTVGEGTTFLVTFPER